jgi:sphingomyelin phosphodiesterase acid-like 3
MKILKNPLRFIYVLFIMVCFFIPLSGSGQKASENTSLSRCLIVSDIHFNPFYDTTLVNQLKKTTYDKWDGIFKGSKVKYDFSTMSGHDSNYGLLMSAMKGMKMQFDDKHPPAFIILAGDFIWHGSAEPPSVASLPNGTKNLLKTNTIKFLAQLFRANFPHTHIIPLFGNNDTDNGNYHKQSPAFRNSFADAWEKGGTDTYGPSLRRNGYYTYHPANTRNLKFIVINSSLVGFNPNLVKPFPDNDAKEMIAWLGRELRKAAKNRNDVWILSHIPPGKNIHDSNEMWRDEYSKMFVDTVAKYARTGNKTTIRTIIASHIHRNDFRVINNTAGPVAYVRTVPSVSPVYGNNPSFEIAEVDKKTNTVINEKTYYFDLTNSANKWNNTFDLQKKLSLSSISPYGITRFINKFKTDTTGLGAYINFFNVGAAVPITADPKNLNRSNYADYLNADILNPGN